MYDLTGIAALEIVNQLTTVLGGMEIGIVISLVVVGIVVPIVGLRLRSKERLDKNKATQRYFLDHGGLEVFSMIYSGKPGGDFHVVPQGAAIPWLILDDYQGTIARSLKSPLSKGERSRVIIRLFSTPVKGRVNGLSIYGLV